MKKVLGLTLCVMLVMLIFASSVFATTYNYGSFTDGAGYGKITKVDENITKIEGGVGEGPYSKASNAKLIDGITEEIHVGINPEELKSGEIFEITVALKNADDEYVSEAVVMSQKINETEVAVTAGWAPNFKAIVDEEGVYTYRWEMYIKEGKAFAKFTLLNYDEVIATTGEVDFDSDALKTNDTKNPVVDEKDVSVKCLWFCNVQVEEGINVYAELPKAEVEPPIEEEKPPVEEENPPVEEENPPVNEEEPPVEDDEKDEKDETPKTGSVDLIAYAGIVVAVIALAGIVTVKKHNK